jgi:hypothetical protein
MRTPVLLSLAIATLALTACGGGSGSSSNPSVQATATPPGSQGSGQSQSEIAVESANSLGTPVKTLQEFNNGTTGVAFARVGRYSTDALANGQCTVVDGVSVEFFAPDKNGDPNSTEEQYFYDTACSQLQRDVVRIYSLNGANETVSRTVNDYLQGSNTAESTRVDSVTIENGTFNSNGFPSTSAGFDRSAQGTLALSNVKTIADDNELVLAAASGNTNAFCGDSAGYNETGVPSLNETFGWQGQTQSGTRTVNGDGSVTWTSTHTGSSVKGAIGALSVAVGTQNTACPIGTPQFTLAGGTQEGTYSIPVTATYMHGVLTNLTITGATLANGNTLNVTTNTGVAPSNTSYITGTISNSTGQIASFSVNDIGDGTLTVTASGNSYTMNDWHVIK